MKFKPRRSSPRLLSFDYQGSRSYHVILNTHSRLSRFRDGRLVEVCLERLAVSASRYGFEVVAYCFMPDHLHLLVTGSDDAPLIRFVQHFKQATGHRRAGLWQRSYYDHVLRYEEDLASVARYIWGNPVRAGIVENVTEYTYSGPREAMAEHGCDAEDRAEALSLRSAARSISRDGS